MKNQNRTNLGIVIAGLPAVGKTTIAQELAKEFDFNLYNGGDILKMLASEKGYETSGNDWWDTIEAKRFMSERRSNPLFDKEVDQKLVELVKNGNVVITSYTLPWLAHENTGIYRKLYGIEFGSDLSVFDFILNTDLLCLKSLIEISKSIIREIVTVT